MAQQKLSATLHAFDHGEPIAVLVVVNNADEDNQNDSEGLPGLWSVTFGPYESSVSLVGNRQLLITALRTALVGLEGKPDALPPREDWTPEQAAAADRIAGAVL